MLSLVIDFNIYTVVMFLSLLMGVLLILSSYVKIKNKPFKKYIKKINYLDIVEKISKGKIIQAIVNPNSKDNKKTLLKLKTMQSSLTLQKILVYKLILGMLIVAALFIVKVSFGTVATKELLNPETIYTTTEYRIESHVATSIISNIGDKYKGYLSNNDYNGLANEVSELNIKLKLGLDDNDILLMTDIFKSTYNATKINNIQILIFFLMSFLSVPFIDIYINIRYKIVRSNMIKEFEKLEIITILLLNRDDLNILEILKEMHRHSRYLKPYLTKCLRLYTSNPKKALGTLIEDVNDPEFKSFIIVLSSCLDKSKEANQDVLKIQRKLRIMLEETTLNKKNRDKELYLTIAQFPLLLLLSLNLLLPVISNISLDF